MPGLLDRDRAGEAAGVDGYVIACFGDPGLDAARELARRAGRRHRRGRDADRDAARAAGSASSPPWAAPWAGPGTSPRTYGLERQCAGVHACDIPVLELEADQDRTYAVILAFAEERPGRPTGRTPSCSGCAGMAELPELLSRRSACRSSTVSAAATLLAEAWSGSGCGPRRTASWRPPPPKAYTGMLERFGH